MAIKTADAIRKANAIPDQVERADILYSLGLKPKGTPILNSYLNNGFVLDDSEAQKNSIFDDLDIHVADQVKVVLKKNGVVCSPKFDDLYELEIHCWQNKKAYEDLSSLIIAA